MKYIPIMRLCSIETKLVTNELSNEKIFPLFEVTDPRNFEARLEGIKEKFGSEFMVELPLYLSEADNKHMAGVLQLIVSAQRESNGISGQSKFYIKNKENIPIPVISGEMRNQSIYNQIISQFQEIKDDFERAAIRIFVSHLHLTSNQKNEIRTIFDLLRSGDIVLLDVVEFEGIETGVLNNIKDIIALKNEKENKNEICILNAFDIRDGRRETHNYTPLICNMFKMDGFGDFATIPRLEASGGGGSQTKIIRYYVHWKHKLCPFISISGGYPEVKRLMKASSHWTEGIANSHFKVC